MDDPQVETFQVGLNDQEPQSTVRRNLDPTLAASQVSQTNRLRASNRLDRDSQLQSSGASRLRRSLGSDNSASNRKSSSKSRRKSSGRRHKKTPDRH